MAQGDRTLYGPAYIANSATNIYTPGSNTYARVKHIHITNMDTSTRSVILYKGATGGSAGGTEVYKNGAIPAGTSVDTYFPVGDKYTTTDFLTGICDAASKCVIEVMGTLEAV